MLLKQLKDLKSNLPSQFRDNIIDYETLKHGIEEVVEKLNKTGIYDLQTHSHLIMENGMKTNIDNHIKETFKKNKTVVDDNTLIEVFYDNNVVTPSSDGSHPINDPTNLPPRYKEEHDVSSVASIYEKDICYNYKEDLEEELKKSQVKLVKFINNAKDKEEIIKGLSLKYYQIVYALKEMEKENGKKELKAGLIVNICKVNPDDLDVQKLLDEITGQNTELFKHEESSEEVNHIDKKKLMKPIYK